MSSQPDFDNDPNFQYFVENFQSPFNEPEPELPTQVKRGRGRARKYQTLEEKLEHERKRTSEYYYKNREAILQRKRERKNTERSLTPSTPLVN